MLIEERGNGTAVGWPLRLLWIPIIIVAGWKHGLPIVFRLVFGLLGLFCLSIGFLIYEDEEQRIQNLLENCWIRLDNLRGHAISIQKGGVASIARVTSRVIDSLLGSRLFSLRALVASSCLSFAFACLYATLDCIHHIPQRTAAFFFAFVTLLSVGNLFIIRRSERLQPLFGC